MKTAQRIEFLCLGLVPYVEWLSMVVGENTMALIEFVSGVL